MRDIRATVQSLISRCCRICKRSSGSDRRRIDRSSDRRVSSCGGSGQGLLLLLLLLMLRRLLQRLVLQVWVWVQAQARWLKGSLRWSWGEK